MKKFSQFTVKDLAIAAVIAALYAALTVVFAPISYGVVQFRIAEALTLLPILFPQAIPGLAVGCLVANLVGGFGIWDVVFGTLATLIAALLTYRLRKNIWFAAAPPVLVNAVIVSLLLHFVLELPLLPTMGTVGLGQLAVVYVLGIPLMLALSRVPAFRNFTDKVQKK
ncbi:MAG TPA: QueT transporter family protein [Candidatus Limiplasma sp.]|nr:QueT transporter family protein [Candidatus Limiplasma sp.]HRX09754.1 QueT transporter family protein [Candidatus Limiplasma sp.]